MARKVALGGQHVHHLRAAGTGEACDWIARDERNKVHEIGHGVGGGFLAAETKLNGGTVGVGGAAGKSGPEQTKQKEEGRRKKARARVRGLAAFARLIGKTKTTHHHITSM